LEERVKLVGDHGSVRIPFDCTRPNPSGLECDNLYIDMNGIIHPCSHPEHGPQPTTEEEMYENVCHYVDRLFRVIRPRKLLYLGIDGVAPRAKMNQQRARRFRSAQEARENLEVEENVRQELTKMGQKVPPLKKPWDSNVITPGTPFMLRLSEFIRFYIRKRISEDKAWQKIRVIFSDASIPGEGEHKIMAHIRLQRSQPGYSPNLVHVLHGLDADLIMLALATHEAHFYISREEVMFGRRSEEMKEQRQLESGFRDKQRQLDEEAGPTAMQLLENKQTPLCIVSIPILREYLANEFAPCITPGRIPFQPSMERMIDDFVFLCFFVGNGASKARKVILGSNLHILFLLTLSFLALQNNRFHSSFAKLGYSRWCTGFFVQCLQEDSSIARGLYHESWWTSKFVSRRCHFGRAGSDRRLRVPNEARERTK
jgi:5'-3' exoribonuclease 2